MLLLKLLQIGTLLEELPIVEAGGAEAEAEAEAALR